MHPAEVPSAMAEQQRGISAFEEATGTQRMLLLLYGEVTACHDEREQAWTRIGGGADVAG